ncbi:predicted protein [Botrytis cinerea T4]|uniref:Uncharacterized protein n=1 Tax=Botryotinia fuckeliana (strain T4) TaxID=999810 RepID=G2YWE9_BOTF4|nr:predicted protein [Botrytis cinerea T4]
MASQQPTNALGISPPLINSANPRLRALSKDTSWMCFASGKQ